MKTWRPWVISIVLHVAVAGAVLYVIWPASDEGFGETDPRISLPDALGGPLPATFRSDETVQPSGHCRGCHNGLSPHPAGIPACETCHHHEWGGGAAAIHHHVFEGLSLDGGHENLTCEQCHAQSANVTIPWQDEEPGRCANCHFARAHENPQALDCKQCHAPERPFSEPGPFEHAPPTVRFPLGTEHQSVDCDECHRQHQDAFPEIRTSAAPTEGFGTDDLPCFLCHDKPHGSLDTSCQTCHTTNTPFVETRIDHTEPLADFTLEGRHLELACVDCHGDHTAAWPPADNDDCQSCHTPSHGEAFGTTCVDCHSPVTGFTPLSFDVSSHAIPLVGRHAALQCATCHEPARDYAPAGETCLDCHQQDAPHTDYRAEANCGECHAPTGWIESVRIDHNATAFPLEGRHTELACDSCHRPNDVWVKPEPVCAECHTPQHRGSMGVFGSTDCSWCHVPTAFSDAQIRPERHQRTDFPLTGRHQRVACISCHVERTPGNPPLLRAVADAACETCHTSRHPEPERQRDCATCHTTDAWRRPR